MEIQDGGHQSLWQTVKEKDWMQHINGGEGLYLSEHLWIVFILGILNDNPYW